MNKIIFYFELNYIGNISYRNKYKIYNFQKIHYEKSFKVNVYNK